jgi:nucleoside-diphosphate-sugar epimerase
MKILVTGSKGFLGKYVVKELEENGYEVVNLDRKNNIYIGSENNPYEINNHLQLVELFNRHNFDAVVHLAALVGLVKCAEKPIHAVEDNLLATTRLLQVSLNKGVKRFIYASTWAVTGNKLNPYDITKAASENMVLSYNHLRNMEGIICRFGTAYGKGMSKLGVIPSFIERAKKGEPLEIHGRGEQIRQFTHAKDIAQGVKIALEKGKVGEIYNIVADEVVSIKEIAESIGEKIEYKPARKADEDYKVIDNSKIKKLGWKQSVSFKEGVAELKNEI